MSSVSSSIFCFAFFQCVYTESHTPHMHELREIQLIYINVRSLPFFHKTWYTNGRTCVEMRIITTNVYLTSFDSEAKVSNEEVLNTLIQAVS